MMNQGYIKYCQLMFLFPIKWEKIRIKYYTSAAEKGSISVEEQREIQ